jgi:hypothetical protein
VRDALSELSKVVPFALLPTLPNMVDVNLAWASGHCRKCGVKPGLACSMVRTPLLVVILAQLTSGGAGP